MREILFRGKRADNGQWVNGFYAHELQGGHFISADEGAWYDGPMLSYVEVIPETVGQYTGLDDKNGVKIFEGDILKDSLSWVCLVKWDDSNGRFLGYHKKPRGDTYVCYVGREPAQEIIGNIHDNPELI